MARSKVVVDRNLPLMRARVRGHEEEEGPKKLEEPEEPEGLEEEEKEPKKPEKPEEPAEEEEPEGLEQEEEEEAIPPLQLSVELFVDSPVVVEPSQPYQQLWWQPQRLSEGVWWSCRDF